MYGGRMKVMIKKIRLLLCVILIVGIASTFVGCNDQGNTTETSWDQSSSEDGSGQTTEPTTSETTTTPTTTETTEPPMPPIEQLLPADEIVESYFGALPEPEQYTEMEHNKLRALYMGAAANLDSAISIAAASEVNAVVIDLKESDGVKYASEVPLALDIGVVQPAYNIQEVIEKLHAADIKVIGRIVCFKDPQLAEARPDLSIQDKNGNQLLFTLEGGKPFVNPYNQEVWQYNIDLALEAISLGVDEIQFDYVRFPTGGTKSGETPWFGEEGTVPSKSQAINRYLQTSAIKIQYELGIPLGADVFGITLVSKLDGNNIGQDWATIGLTGIDNLAPMIYPSHYANSSSSHYTGNGKGTNLNGKLFPKPDLEPYEVMYQSLLLGQEATRQEGYAVNRPYLQAFTARYLPSGYYKEYSSADIKAQIDAIYDAGYEEWICWNAYAIYPQDAFRPEA